MNYDIPAFTGTITTISGTQGRPKERGICGYHGSDGQWCPTCKANGKYSWIEAHEVPCQGDGCHFHPNILNLSN